MVTTQDREVRAWRKQVGTRVKVAGSGPPLVFFHGMYGLQWDPFLDALAETHTVYAPEHPGTTPGAPDEIKPIDTLWDLVLYYYELFDELGLDAPALVGHSFGGMVAAEVAATNPGRVSKLVLIDPIGLWRDDKPVRNAMLTAAEDLPALLFADADGPLARMMAAASAPSGDVDIQAMIATRVQMMWSLACTAKFTWPIPDRGLKKRLHRISAPSLIVWGKQDRLVDPAYAADFAAAIPNARVELIEGAGHVPQVEQIAATSALVREFLES